MEIRFYGGEADDHLVELYSGAESLSGIGRVGSLVAHYVATGNVRFRGPYSERINFFISGVEDGSLRVVVRQIARLASEARSAAAQVKTSRLLRHIVARGVGQADEGGVQIGDDEIPQGTIDALVEAATPGLLRAHRWIDLGAKRISIDPEGARPIALNEDTKEYLETEEVAPQRETQDVSVGALNVNSRNGRVYFHDLGRTVPFYVSRDASPRAIPTLARYLTQYAEKTGATVNIEFLRVRYPDGRLKRVIIFECYSLRDAA